MYVYGGVLYLNSGIEIYPLNYSDVLTFDGTTWSTACANSNVSFMAGKALISYNSDIYAGGSAVGADGIARLHPTMGINEYSLQSSVLVSPNPASGFLNLQLSSDVKANALSIFSSTGTLAYIGKYSNQVDISQLSSGVYFLVIPTETGVLRKGFVVEK